MSKDKNLSMEQIKDRKQKLQHEVERIEQKYGSKASALENRVQSTLKPLQTIRDNPFKSVGIAIALGFLAGIAGKRKSKKTVSSGNGTMESSPGHSGFSSLLMNELKRMAARRAMVYITEWVDHKVLPEISGTKNINIQNPSSQERSAESSKVSR